MSHASIDPATRAERALPEDLIRLCVGIEDVNDLIQDLESAVRLPNHISKLPKSDDVDGDGWCIKIGYRKFAN